MNSTFFYDYVQKICEMGKFLFPSFLSDIFHFRNFFIFSLQRKKSYVNYLFLCNRIYYLQRMIFFGRKFLWFRAWSFIYYLTQSHIKINISPSEMSYGWLENKFECIQANSNGHPAKLPHPNRKLISNHFYIEPFK